MDVETRTGGDGAAGKRSTRWILVLFGLPFAAVGIGLLGWLVGPTLFEWQAMKSWEAVPAEVLQAELRSHAGDGSTTYEATAHYRYTYAGIDYESDRVAIGSGSDNLGDFQQRLGAQLEGALARGEPVTVYVDPSNPHSAVVSRELRTGFIVFMTLFALVFAVIGVAIMAAGLFGKDGDTGVRDSERPWQARAQWASPLIESDTRNGARAAWFFAFIWCAISAPATLAIPGELEKGNWPILLILLFDIIGIGLVVWATRLTVSARKFGSVPLQMDPHPGAIGGDVGGYIDIPVAHDPARLFRVSLSCTRSYETGSGKNRSTHHDVKWQDETWLEAEPLDANHVRLWFRFQPPAGLPASEEPSRDYHAWHLDLSAELPGIDLSRRYELPVFATAARSARQVAQHVRASNVPHLAAIEALTNLEQVPGGAAMDFRAGRHLVGGLMLAVVFGGGFGGGGIAMLLSSADVVAKAVIGGIFSLVGALCVAGGLWMAGNRLRVEAGDAGVVIRRWLFGVPVATREVPRAQIEGIGITRGMTTTSASGTTVYYDLVLRVAGDQVHGIGDGFRGVSQARQAAESFGLYARLPWLGELDSGAAFAARKAAYLAARDKTR